MKRTLLVVLSVIAGLLLSTGIAAADPPPFADPPAVSQSDSAQTRGASATCTVSGYLDAISCSVRDTEADKHSVFVEWKDTAGREGRFDNNSGATREESFTDDSLWRGVDNSTLQWHVCVDIQWNNDRCSDYVSHAVGPNGLTLDVYCEAPSSASLAATCTQIQNLPTDDGWELSRECLQGVASTALGLARDGRAAIGRGLLKKVPGIGWALTAYGVTTAVTGCR